MPLAINRGCPVERGSSERGLDVPVVVLFLGTHLHDRRFGQGAEPPAEVSPAAEYVRAIHRLQWQ